MEAGIHELTPGYALDALDDAEREAFEAHLPECARCQEELASFWEVASALAVAAGGPEPSAGLRERIAASIRDEPQATPASARVVALRSRRIRRPVPLLAAAGALAAFVAIGLGVYAAALHGRLGDTRGALAQERAAAAVLADPAARAIPLARGEGRLVVAATGAAVIVLRDLAPAPAGKTYQVWVVRGARPRPAGLFQGAPPSVVSVRGNLQRGDVVAVTLERSGGAAAPTGTPLIASQPA